MSRSSRKILIIAVVSVACFGLVGVLLVGCGIGSYLFASRIAINGAQFISDSRIGTEAPEIMLTTVDGKAFRLSELRGRPVILNFWATWCTPCVEEVATLQACSTRYSQEIVIVGINADEPRNDVLDFIDEHALTFTMLLDPDSRIQNLYEIRGFPTTFIIDREGIIRAVHIGYLSDVLLADYLGMVGVN